MDKGIDSFNDSGSDSDVATNSQYVELQTAINKSDLETVHFCSMLSNGQGSENCGCQSGYCDRRPSSLALRVLFDVSHICR